MQTGELNNMKNGLLGIRYNIEKSRTDGKVQNLASYINKGSLLASHKKLSAKKAVGVNGISKDDYSINLEANIEHLVGRMKRGSYKPESSRRVYIPKDGSDKMRPLGISCYEDKVVENVVASILTEVYEPKFYNESYGFRPRRSCHQAIRELVENIQYRKTSYIVEADIKSFFDKVDHDWMIKFLEHDIADKKFFRCKVKTSTKKLRSKINTMKYWIKNNRTMQVGELIKKINQKLRGHYQYYGVTDNTRSVISYLSAVKHLLYKWLNRRSQKRSYSMETFYNGLLKTVPLMEPTIKVSLFYR